MERKIQWSSGCFDEIDLVYGKAAEKEATAKILADLEAGALAEAKAYSGNIQIDGRAIAPQQFDTLPDRAKEHVMFSLSNMGLASFQATLTEPKIVLRLTPHIQYVRCCTAFSILNRLEKLDGAFNMLHPQATLEIQAPLGGKKGLVQIEMLIAMLYPWLKVTEVSSNELAANVAQSQPPAAPAPAPQARPAANMPMQNRQNTSAAPQNQNPPQNGGKANKKKFSLFALIVAVIALLIFAKGAAMLMSSLQPAAAPPELSAISGKDLEKGEYYYGKLQVLCTLGYTTSKGYGVTSSSQFYLAAFQDAEGVWNYVMFKPQVTRPLEGEFYEGCFKAGVKNKTITGWKDEAIALYDGEFFPAEAKRYDTTYSLDCHFATVEEYMKDYEEYQMADVFGALFVLGIGLAGLYYAWKRNKRYGK